MYGFGSIGQYLIMLILCVIIVTFVPKASFCKFSLYANFQTCCFFLSLNM